ncbi:MAG: efflux RND transporter periplasmic adaptor subunit [Acidobacteriota bacterium]|nr:efflux RND transporter periplasmic adaptor subunit [Acidobacteriota bacterium]
MELARIKPASSSELEQAAVKLRTSESDLAAVRQRLIVLGLPAQKYEKDLGRIRTGSGASVTTDAYPGRIIRGQVTYIDPEINTDTRTAQARVELENAGQILKIGQYVNVAFGSMGMAEKTVPTVPIALVQNLGNRQVIFVATDNPNVFIVRFVRLGAETSGQYLVLEGLSVGDKIVTDGSFLLRAEWLKQHPANQ